MASATATPSASAIDPISRNGKSKYKFSLAAYSYRSLLQGANAQLTLDDFIDDCAAMGLEGTELTSYYFPGKVTKEYLHGLRQRCFRLGLDVSGTAVGNDFGASDDNKRQQAIEHVKQWSDHAAALGAPVIRIFAGHVAKGADETVTHKRMVAAIEECCQYAGERGIHLALENHCGPTATANGLLSFVNDVSSPWFGVNLDTGNFPFRRHLRRFGEGSTLRTECAGESRRVGGRTVKSVRPILVRSKSCSTTPGTVDTSC